MKKAIVISLVLCMLFALCACFNYSTTYTETVTENGVSTTTTTTNNNGVVTTETSQSIAYPDGSCGALAEDGELHSVPITLENQTGEDIIGFYFCEAGATEFTNLFSDGLVLEDGESTEPVNLRYGSDYMNWDLGIQTADGEWQHFSPLDISDLDVEGFTITFLKSDGDYGWKVDKSFVK